ncbi:hypothetical protein ACIQMJ_26800 [Actinosynnema sp. NPDC091369]
MTERRLPWLWPSGPVAVLLPAAAIAVVVLWGSGPMLSWPYQEWIRTSAEFHQQNAFAAPIAAAAATCVAGRLTPPTRIFALPVAARSGTPTVRRHLAVLVTSFVVAYLLGLLPLVVATIRDAEHGGPSIGVMVTGLLGIVTATALGYLIGVLCRTALAVPLTFVLVFGVTLLGTSGDTFAALSPVLQLEPGLGRTETLPFVAYRLAFLSSLVVTTAWAAVKVLRNHRANSPLPPLKTLLPLVLPVLLIVPPLVDKPALFAYEADPAQVCRTERDVRYCVHAGHRSRLDLLVESTDAKLVRYGAPTPKITKVYDEAIRGHIPGTGDEWRRNNEGIVWIPIQPQSPAEANATPVVNILSGMSTCHLPRPGRPGPADPQATRLASEFREWLIRPGDTTPGSAFHGIPEPVVREWISSNRQKIEECSLGSGDLP